MAIIRRTIVLFFLLVSLAHAETIVQYTMTGDSLNTTTNATGIAGSILAKSSLGTFEANSLGYTTDPEIRVIPPASTTTATLAVTNNAYFSFTVTPTNKEMDFSTLTFNIARGGAATPRGWALRSSLDSYTNTIDTGVLYTARPTWTEESVDLTGASFQNLTTAVTFRIYFYTPSTSYSIEIDDITLNGTVSDIQGGGSLATDTYEDVIPVITRYIEMERSGTTLTAKIYSDANYSVLLDTLNVTTTADTHRYLSMFPTYNSSTVGTSFSGSVSDLDITAGTAGASARTSITITGQNLSVSFP